MMQGCLSWWVDLIHESLVAELLTGACRSTTRLVQEDTIFVPSNTAQTSWSIQRPNGLEVTAPRLEV